MSDGCKLDDFFMFVSSFQCSHQLEFTVYRPFITTGYKLLSHTKISLHSHAFNSYKVWGHRSTRFNLPKWGGPNKGEEVGPRRSFPTLSFGVFPSLGYTQIYKHMMGVHKAFTPIIMLLSPSGGAQEHADRTHVVDLPIGPPPGTTSRHLCISVRSWWVQQN